MFYGRSLLERLRDPEHPDSRSMSEDPSLLEHSILINLRRLFNSRQGHAPAQLDFGIPPPSQIALAKDALIEMRSRLKESIEKYEPRLDHVEVRHIQSEEDAFALRFQIRARLRVGAVGERFSFDTLVRPSGRIDLRI